MSIFARIFKIGQAATNKVVDKLEKPELMLEQAIRDKDKQIQEARKAVQSCIATERATKAMLEKEKAEKFTWEQKAEMALKAGKEELAVRALQRATEHEQKMTTLDTKWQTQRASVDELKKESISLRALQRATDWSLDCGLNQFCYAANRRYAGGRHLVVAAQEVGDGRRPTHAALGLGWGESAVSVERAAASGGWSVCWVRSGGCPRFAKLAACHCVLASPDS